MRTRLGSALALALLSVWLALPLTGCAHPAALPAGAVDQVDASANTIIQVAYAFANRITLAVQSTDPNVHVTLTPAQLQLLDKLNLSINVASSLEQAYHAAPSAAAVAQLNAATATVQINLSTAEAQLPPTPGK